VDPPHRLVTRHLAGNVAHPGEEGLAARGSVTGARS
jgi:hypothetical protein